MNMNTTADKLDFKKFLCGTLFLIRTPESFPEGYAEKSFQDMKENLKLDYAAWLETWNCVDGIIWQHPDYPRSSYWAGCDRDPLEEAFAAADKVDMAFLPECGVIHTAFREANRDAMRRLYDSRQCGYGRMGLVPAAPVTADFLIAKYEALFNKFGHHKSFKGFCMPAENCVQISYDNYTLAEWKKRFSFAMPSPQELAKDFTLQKQVNAFLEDLFLEMYRKLARHLKQKYDLPLMHYPVSKISATSHHVPGEFLLSRNLELIDEVEEIDLLNLQLHPPLGDHVRQFKLEMELLEGCTDKPCVADTHWYHEANAGKYPNLTPERMIDWNLSTITPNGISFFCYGFMKEELPLWKKELNPNTPVFNCYRDEMGTALRRKYAVKGMEFARQIGDFLQNKKHVADTAIFYRESLDDDYRFGSYYREHLFSVYESLQSAALPLCVSNKIPVDTTQYKCLIFTAVKSITGQEAENLQQFLQNGGKVIIIGKSDPLLYQICGLEVCECDAEYVTVDSSPDSTWAFSLPVDAVKHTANGNIRYAYNRGNGAIVQQGNVIFVGCWAAISDFENKRQQGIKNMWKKLFDELELDCNIKFTADHVRFKGEHEFVSCDIYQAPQDDKKTILLRNFGVETTNAQLQIGDPDKFSVQSFIIDGKVLPYPADGKLPDFEYFALLELIKNKG